MRTSISGSALNPSCRDGPRGPRTFGHGEMIRDGVDRTLTIDPRRLRCLYQGTDPGASSDHPRLRRKPVLPTRTDSSC